MTRRSSLLVLMTVLALSLSAGLSAQAADATGTWTWSSQFRDQTVETTLNLKQDGDKLTGTISGRGDQTTPIEEGKVEGDEISFQVTRERGDNRFVTKYKGKVEGDTLKGEIETQFGDQTRTREFEAKRAK